MAYRVFTDSQGTEWQTWDVVPRLAERRREQRRRAAVGVGSERRRAERRVLQGRRPLLTDALQAGWLCFEAPVEKRRLTPIPADWQRCAIDQLEQYCREASPAGRVIPTVDILHLPMSDN